MSLIDRILNGEFDDESKVVAPANKATAAQTKPRATDPDEDEEELDDEDTPMDDDEGEFDDPPFEEVDDQADSDMIQADSDIPSEEWMREYVKENGIEVVDETELVTTAQTQYIEKPKQSKVREIKKTMSTTENTQETPKPKQSAATEGVKKRGAPYKLVEHAEEVCRLYTEGVGAKTIAEKFGVSVSCVINTLKRNNVAIRPKGRRKAST